ncbi:MAG: zinc metalloprotease HtpX [Thermoplasmata archaeon]
MDIIGLKLKVASVIAGIGIALLAAILVYSVMYYFYGYTGTGIIGIVLILVLFMDIFQWLIGPYIIGFFYHVHPVGENDEESFLIPMIREVADLNHMKPPKMFISEMRMPNAFAYGSPLAGKRIAVTRGLLAVLNRDEIRSVLGHEIGHLRHHDAELLLAIGLIPTVIFYFGYTMIFSGDRKGNGSSFIIAIAVMAISFLFSIMVMGVNRMREAYADVNSAKTIPGGAENLQRALAKIDRNSVPIKKSTASMLLFSDDSRVSGDVEEIIERWRHQKVPVMASILSDHPHPARRIQILENYRNRDL